MDREVLVPPSRELEIGLLGSTPFIWALKMYMCKKQEFGTFLCICISLVGLIVVKITQCQWLTTRLADRKLIFSTSIWRVSAPPVYPFPDRLSLPLYTFYPN